MTNGLLCLHTLRNLPLKGRVHSVFEHALNVEVDHGGKCLLTVVQSGEWLPDSIQVDNISSFCSCKPGDTAILTDDSLQIGYFVFALRKGVYEGQIKMGSSVDYLKKMLQNLPLTLHVPRDYEERVYVSIKKVCAAVKSDMPATAERACYAILGLGSGLTPAADDALVGAFAALWHDAPVKPFLSEGLLSRTTDVSGKYLRCAQLGFFSKRVLDLFHAENEADTEKAISEVLSWGASSGMDMLWGLSCAMDAWKEHTSSLPVIR